LGELSFLTSLYILVISPFLMHSQRIFSPILWVVYLV
jgi:hypothetical protein